MASKGLKAVIPTSQITVSQEGRIQLTGKLSVDLDLNPNYAMTFDWYCATIHNGSCTIIDSEQTLEEKMGVAEFRKADLDISAEFLPVGQYIFSLNVSKGEKWSETQASVEITLESIPEVRIVALDNMALPGKKFVATGNSIDPIGVASGGNRAFLCVLFNHDKSTRCIVFQPIHSFQGNGIFCYYTVILLFSFGHSGNWNQSSLGK